MNGSIPGNRRRVSIASSVRMVSDRVPRRLDGMVDYEGERVLVCGELASGEFDLLRQFQIAASFCAGVT